MSDAQQLLDDMDEIRELLITALGGPDAIHGPISTVHLAHAVKSQTGGLRAGIRSAGRVCGRWADELTEYIETAPVPDARVVAVRDALDRHRWTE